MSEYIPDWVWAIFGLGSPVQELINRWVPERIRPITLWAVAAGIVIGVILLSPLDWDAFNIQLALVYAVLTGGWAMSNALKPPLKAGTARAIAIFIGVAALGVGFRAMAQPDSTFVPDGFPPASDTIFTSNGQFIRALIFSFVGSLATRWLGKERPGSFRAK